MSTEFFEKFGFEKHIDLYAYYFDVRVPRNLEAVAYAMKRFGFSVDPIDLNRLEEELVDIKRALDEAMPEEWPDLIPPDIVNSDRSIFGGSFTFLVINKCVKSIVQLGVSLVG